LSLGLGFYIAIRRATTLAEIKEAATSEDSRRLLTTSQIVLIVVFSIVVPIAAFGYWRPAALPGLIIFLAMVTLYNYFVWKSVKRRRSVDRGASQP
jgi:hypothetical protein